MSRPDFFFPTGTASVLARCVSAEIRARLAAERWTQRDLAARAGFRSQNYLSIRLRDEKPLTLDDVERIAEAFDDEVTTLIKTALERQSDWVWDQLPTRAEGPSGQGVEEDLTEAVERGMRQSRRSRQPPEPPVTDERTGS